MTPRFSRRQTVQAAFSAAAVAAVPRVTAAARQATPVAVEGSSITVAQVEAAVAQLDGLVEAAMARNGVPGAAVAVVYNDAVVYQQAFGIREVGKPEKITPETVFQLASMSKSISSTLVAAVIGDGAITWDTVAADALPGFALSDPWLTSQVTLRDLFSHRSGLPAYAGDTFSATFGYGREESVRRLRYLPAATPPRTTFAYANLPLSVAAFAAAHAAGQTWEDLADTRLFAPLGMSSTSYRFADYMSRTNKAAPHYPTADGTWALGEVTDGDTAAPAGGVSTNLQDLTQWVRLQLGSGMFEGSEVVASAPLLETRRPQILENSPPNPADGAALFYGLGWRLQYDQQGRLRISHIGDFNAGFRTGVSLIPAEGLGIMVLTNAWPNSLSDGIPNTFFELVTRGETTKDWTGEIEAEMAASIAAVKSLAPFPRGDAPANSPALSLDAYTGTYTNVQLGDLIVRDVNGGLVMELGPLPAQLPLEHWDRDIFTYPLPPSGEVLLGKLGVEFLIGASGTATAMAFGLPTVGPDSTAMFTRTATGA